MFGAQPIIQLVLGVELLAADAVEPAVGALVDIAIACAGSPELVYAVVVPLVHAGADEVVERKVERVSQRVELRRVAVDQLLRGDALALGGANILKAVLVGRSEEHTSELQSRQYLVCRLLLEKKKNNSS